jgi:O-antigen ligase
MTTATIARPAAAPARKFRFGATATTQIPRSVYIPLLLTLVTSIASNTITSGFAVVMNNGKWAPLVVLLVASVTALSGRRGPRCPPIVFFALALLAMLSGTGSYLGIQPGRGVLPLITVIVVVGVGYAVAAVLVVTDTRRAFFDLIAIICRILIIGAFLFFAARINLGRGGGFSAWVDNPNTLAAMLAPGMVVFVAGCIERRPGWKLWHLSFLLVGFPLLAATNARASFVWVALAMGAFWIYRRGSWPLVVSLMIGAVVMTGWWGQILSSLGHFLQLDVDPTLRLQAGPLSGREEVWRVGWELFLKRPTFGYGLGTSKALIELENWRFVRHSGAHFHSSYLTSLVETGVMGFIALMVALVATVARGIADSRRTQALPRESWPTAALPFALVLGGLGHAIFESWIIAAGNVNAPLFWICFWLIHLQAQIPVRPVTRRAIRAAQDRPSAVALPAQ